MGQAQSQRCNASKQKMLRPCGGKMAMDSAMAWAAAWTNLRLWRGRPRKTICMPVVTVDTWSSAADLLHTPHSPHQLISASVGSQPALATIISIATKIMIQRVLLYISIFIYSVHMPPIFGYWCVDIYKPICLYIYIHIPRGCSIQVRKMFF
jgi:hypothetical protein